MWQALVTFFAFLLDGAGLEKNEKVSVETGHNN